MRNLARKIEDYVFFHIVFKDLTPLTQGFGSERLSPYNYNGLDSTAQQIRKYRYNSRLSLEYFELISFLEILLRNSISKAWANQLKEDFPLHHTSFETRFGYQTDKKTGVIIYDSSGKPAQSKQLKNIKLAIQAGTKTAKQKTRPIVCGDVIANLSFGFWRFCFDPYFHPINLPQINKIFPFHDMNKRHPDKVIGRTVQMLEKINSLRNRIAHHDKIFHKKELRREYLFNILTLIKWIDPEALKFTNRGKIEGMLDSGWAFLRESYYEDFPPNTF